MPKNLMLTLYSEAPHELKPTMKDNTYIATSVEALIALLTDEEVSAILYLTGLTDLNVVEAKTRLITCIQRNPNLHLINQLFPCEEQIVGLVFPEKQITSRRIGLALLLNLLNSNIDLSNSDASSSHIEQLISSMKEKIFTILNVTNKKINPSIFMVESRAALLLAHLNKKEIQLNVTKIAEPSIVLESIDDLSKVNIEALDQLLNFLQVKANNTKIYIEFALAELKNNLLRLSIPIDKINSLFIKAEQMKIFGKAFDAEQIKLITIGMLIYICHYPARLKSLGKIFNMFPAKQEDYENVSNKFAEIMDKMLQALQIPANCVTRDIFGEQGIIFLELTKKIYKLQYPEQNLSAMKYISPEP